ncbi:MAG: RNA polymerase sporulation sigma factor SigH [Clostridiales bacterium]|nr:RNA polymerase sporulation sigma factor SigH [Clostridiales bacterium]
MTDEQLVEQIKNNDKKALEYLMDKYINFVYLKAKPYFIVGAEKQDIVQEGLIGLYKAIKSFNNEKQSSFRVFADLCIRRQIISAIKMSTRQKQLPLNNCLSLNSTFEDENGDKALVDILENKIAPDPSDTIANKEMFLTVKNKISNILSDFEKTVLDRHLCGYTYTQIATSLEVEPKSVDNAMQRIKKKMEKNIINNKENYY